MDSLYKQIKNDIKPVIKSVLTLLEKEDEEALIGHLVILAQRVQKEDAMAALELSILAMAADKMTN